MGRWAQRKRSGGGPKQAYPLLSEMTNAFITDPTFAIVEWNSPVNQFTFAPADFVSDPSQEIGIDITQNDDRSLAIEFGGTITGDFEVQYTGDTAGFKSPDEEQY